MVRCDDILVERTGGGSREMALPTIDLDVLHFALVLALTIEFG